MFKKKFCFSSQARTVAMTLALIDTAFGIVFTLMMSFFLYIFLNYPETLRTLVQENPDKQRDLEKLLAWGPVKQWVCLAVPMTASVMNIIMGISLFIAAKRRSVLGIKLWFILSIIFTVISMILFVPEVIFTQDKNLLIFFSLIDYTYDAYSIWIVSSLIDELTAHSRNSSLTPVHPHGDGDGDMDPDTELTSNTFNSIRTNKYSSSI